MSCKSQKQRAIHKQQHAEMSYTGVLNTVNLVQYLNVLYLKSRIQFKFTYKSFIIRIGIKQY